MSQGENTGKLSQQEMGAETGKETSKTPTNSASSSQSRPASFFLAFCRREVKGTHLQPRCPQRQPELGGKFWLKSKQSQPRREALKVLRPRGAGCTTGRGVPGKLAHPAVHACASWCTNPGGQWGREQIPKKARKPCSKTHHTASAQLHHMEEMDHFTHEQDTKPVLVLNTEIVQQK